MSATPDATTLDATALAAHMPLLPELTQPADFAGQALPGSLAELELLVRRELDLTRYPAKSWVLPHIGPDGAPALDALIVGGGQAGLAAAFGLMQQRVTNILVIDENEAGTEGPWGTYARMDTLRTQKEAGGIELGIPSLSFRAWYEVQSGLNWDTLYKIPTRLWDEYLKWYRRVLSLPVSNQCRLTALHPAEGGLIAAEILDQGQPRTIFARSIVLATGIEGNGSRYVPGFIADALAKSLWAHSHEVIDFTALASKTVAVLGGSASAFDNAIIAAEHGADVHVFHRDRDVRGIYTMAWGEFTGYLAHFADLPLADRWRFSRQMRRLKSGPPLRTVQRAQALPNLRIHPGTSWNTVHEADGRIAIAATDGALIADFAILGTGYVTDLTVVEEMAGLLPLMALWRDMFTPPDGEQDEALLNSPCLGPNFETLEKHKGTAPWLNAVFNFSRGATLSMGAMPIGLSGIKFGVPRLVEGVSRRLFLEDAPRYFAGMTAWQESDARFEL